MSELVSKEALRIAVLDTDWHDDTDADVALDMIDEAPTVEERKHGHWKKSDFPSEKYCCSVCGAGCWYYDYQGDVARSRFCPQCGAKMNEVSEDE